jgi:TatD DNase family protein
MRPCDDRRVTQPSPTPFGYADSHTHLDRYGDAEVAAMVQRAGAAGIRLIVTVGSDIPSSARAIALALRLPQIVTAAGVHPLHVAPDSAAANLAAIRALAIGEPTIVRAIGEIGLDASAGVAPSSSQLALFEAQLALASERRLPVIVHSASAHREVAEVLQTWRGRLPAVVIHYFTGAAADLSRFLDLDCHVSFGRNLIKPNRAELRSLSAVVPLDRLLVETDTYPLPGRTTEPRDVVEVVEAIADARGLDQRTVAAWTVRNLREVLGLEAESGSAGS